MLSGVNPLKKGLAMETAHAILGENPPPLTRYREDIPVLLQHTVKKMLAKDPNQRYQLVHEVRTDLAELIGESGDSQEFTGEIQKVLTPATAIPTRRGWRPHPPLRGCPVGGSHHGKLCHLKSHTLT